MSGMTDFAFSLQMRDTIKRLAETAVQNIRPDYRYGEVVEIDVPNMRCSVLLNGDPQPVLVPMGARLQPTFVGQIVRVDGRRGDRFISDIVTPEPVDDPADAEAWRVVGSAGQPAFVNSHSYFGGGHATVKFYKDKSGVVHLSGMMNSPNTSGGFTLPVGYRPAATEYFPGLFGDGLCLIGVNNGGVVFRNQPTTGSSWLNLDGIKFLAQQNRDEHDEAIRPFQTTNTWVGSAGMLNNAPATWKRDDGFVLFLRGGLNGGSGQIGRIADRDWANETYMWPAFGWGSGGVITHTRIDYNGWMSGLQLIAGANDLRFTGISWFAGPEFSSEQWILMSPLTASWVPYVNFGAADSLWRPPSYYKDKYGTVHLHGLMKNGTYGDSSVFFNLPAGYRPAERLLFAAFNNGATNRLEVHANGNCVAVTTGGGNNLYQTLDSISFRAEQ